MFCSQGGGCFLHRCILKLSSPGSARTESPPPHRSQFERARPCVSGALVSFVRKPSVAAASCPVLPSGKHCQGRWGQEQDPPGAEAAAGPREAAGLRRTQVEGRQTWYSHKAGRTVSAGAGAGHEDLFRKRQSLNQTAPQKAEAHSRPVGQNFRCLTLKRYRIFQKS